MAIKQRFLWAALALGALGVAACIAFTIAVSSSVQQEIERTRAALARNGFECPSGSRENIERWGEIGWARFCTRDGENHGPWQAWERQRLAISGGFSQGRRHGTWQYFNEDGSTQKALEYSDDELLLERAP